MFVDTTPAEVDAHVALLGIFELPQTITGHRCTLQVSRCCESKGSCRVDALVLQRHASACAVNVRVPAAWRSDVIKHACMASPAVRSVAGACCHHCSAFLLRSAAVDKLLRQRLRSVKHLCSSS